MIKLVISQEFQTFNVHFSSLRRMSLLIAMWPMRDKCKFHKTSILTMFWVIIFKKVWWLVKPWSRASISRTRLFLICWSRISRGNCEAGIVRWPHVIPLCRVASQKSSWKVESLRIWHGRITTLARRKKILFLLAKSYLSISSVEDHENGICGWAHTRKVLERKERDMSEENGGKV